MPNLLTPLDMLGSLIDPRDEDETLVDYKDRLSEVAEVVLARDLTYTDTGSWREAREQELEGRLGAEVTLRSGEDDSQLREQSEEKLLTFENVADRSRSFRWPRFDAQGEQPRFGKAAVPNRGVASPTHLALENEDVLQAAPGYVAVGGQLYYVPGDLKTTAFHLPSGTETTALPPWHIASDHPHRIEVIDHNTLRLVGADGHEHEISRGGAQENYDPAGSGRSNHNHAITIIDAEGPAYAQTRPHVPATSERRPTSSAVLDGKDFASVRPSRGFAVPSLQTREVSTDSDSTGHSHTAEVSPHDFWSGNFPLPGQDHNHRVENWTVSQADEHTHTISQPAVPDQRPLVPRLTMYEDRRLKPSVPSPYALNLKMKDGWVVGTCPGGFSEMLVLGFGDGGAVEVPPPEEREGTVGLGPSAGPDHFYLEATRRQVGYDLVIRARLEDKHTGGIPHKKVTARWDLSESTPPSVDYYTNKDGVATVRVPTSANQTSYTVELSAGPVTRTKTFELRSLGEPGGYGIDYGLEYGS